MERILKFGLCIIAGLFLFSLATPANALLIMIGDNDGYGYGDSVVPDGAVLPGAPDSWIFDNRSLGESAATDGSQCTDVEPLEPMSFSFMFDPVPNAVSALFTVDVSGIQTALFGASSISLDGDDYSGMLPTEQGAWGSGVYTTAVPLALLEDGQLRVDFIGGSKTHSPIVYDNIAFDCFSLEVQPVPEPATMLLLGTGLVGLGVIGRKKFKK